MVWKVPVLVGFIGAALGVTLWWDVHYGSRAPLAWAAAMVPVVTFLAFLFWFSKGINKLALRNSIAATFVVTFFVLLGIFMFFNGFRDKDGKPTDPPMITQTLLDEFNLLMGGVMAFYFGTISFEPDRNVTGNGAHATSPVADSSGNYTATLIPGSYVATAEFVAQDGAKYSVEEKFAIATGEDKALDLRLTKPS